MENRESLLKKKEGLLQLKGRIKTRMKKTRERYDLGYMPRSKKYKNDFYLGKNKAEAYKDYEKDVKALATVNEKLAEVKKKLNAFKDINDKMEEWFIESELF